MFQSRYRRYGQSGFSSGEVVAGAAVASVLIYSFFFVWDWIGDTVDRRVEKEKQRNSVGRLVDAEEEVVDLNVRGGYVITFRTG